MSRIEFTVKFATFVFAKVAIAAETLIATQSGRTFFGF